ncbi:MAG: STAS domain-containing protein [Planctomycetota bacterium]|jgi:ABC-type transporter Mla MlaB component
MKHTQFQIAFLENGRLLIQLRGKLTGHAARKGLDILQLVVRSGWRQISLDLHEISSVDSLGLAIFDWIRGQNGSLDISITPPMLDMKYERLKPVAIKE